MSTRVLLVALMAASGFAFAQDQDSSGETSVKLEEMKPSKVVGEKTDQVITNRKLRAESGSKSKWSLSASGNYSGATLEQPFSRLRPNITAGGNTETVSTLSGGFGGKYRFSAKDNISLDVALRMVAPFNGGPDDNGTQELEVDNPSLTYTHIDSFAGIQSVSKLDWTHYTAETLRDNLQIVNALGVQQIFLYDLGKSGASVGMLLAGTKYYIGNLDQVNADGKPVRERVSDYTLGAYPFFEYVINDTFNLRTIAGLWVYDKEISSPRDVYTKNVIYQSVGLGTSITRDIFLYPNVQFLPEDMDIKKTNWAVSATVNMF